MLPGYSKLHSSSILKELSSWRVKKAAGCSCGSWRGGSASLCQHLHSLPSLCCLQNRQAFFSVKTSGSHLDGLRSYVPVK